MLAHGGFTRTCLPRRPVNGGITFLKRTEQVTLFSNLSERLFVFIPDGTDVQRIPGNVSWLICEKPGLEFALVHNALDRQWATPDPVGHGCRIHETVELWADGLWFADTPDGKRIRLESKGLLYIGHGIDIGAFSVIHRGLVDTTRIESGVKIGSRCSVGHDTVVGEDSILTVGVTLGGCCDVGERVFFGLGSTVKSEVLICSNVMIGAGAVVVNDIKESGKYVGVPARKLE